MFNKRDVFKGVFLTGLFLSPFIFWLPAEIPYEIPRVLFIQRWIELIVILGIILIFPGLDKEKIDSKIVILISIFLLITFISSFFGVDFLKSIVGNYYRGDGLVTLVHLVTLSFVIMLFVSRLWIKSVIYAIAFGGVGISVWAVLDGFRLYILGIQNTNNWEGAIYVSFGNPNFMAGYLLVTLPFLYFLWQTSKNIKAKIIWFAVFLLQITAILLTFSWSGVFGIVIFFLLSLFMKGARKRKIQFILPVLILPVLILFFMIDRQKQIIPGRIIAEGRERVFMKGILAFKDKPILGWGWSNFDYAFDSVDWPIHFEDDVFVDKAHSIFLEILVTTGIIGLLCYLGLVLRVGINLRRGNTAISNVFLLSFLLYIIHSQTNVISVAEEVIFWTIVGLSAIDIKTLDR